MGGQWVLLGSFTMNASTAYSIALSDNPNGAVAADAVRIVPVVSSAEKFTWTPTIPSSGSYDVYARWVASSANTGSATYTVTHAGGATNVAVNQKQNGGAWVKLGMWCFDPAQGLPSGNDPRVELLGAIGGRVVADGLRFVSAGTQAANIAYIHSDHLGSPQKMTDTNQALTWDGQFDPFGEEFLVSGSAAMPQRFPGQYADAETGYSYNYFRDYDPTTGRYIESDPIGLRGGLNTYRYVNDSPLQHADPTGLECVTCKPRHEEGSEFGQDDGGGWEYKDGIKMCTYICETKCGRRFELYAPGQGENCFGVVSRDYVNPRDGSLGSAPAYTEPFEVCTDSFWDRHWFYGSEFVDAVDEALKN